MANVEAGVSCFPNACRSSIVFRGCRKEIYDIVDMGRYVEKIMKSVCHIGVRALLVLPYLFDKLYESLVKCCFQSCGSGVYLRPSSCDLKGLGNMIIGNNVSIPRGAIFYSTEARLVIRDNVIFGPRPTIVTGDHRIDVIGVPIISSHEKLPENE